MKTEETMADMIDALATKKAREFNERVLDAISQSMERFWRDGKSNGDYLGETVRMLLQHFIDKGSNACVPGPTKEVIAHYRTQIVDELLTKLPLVRELSLMQEIEP